MNWYLLFTNIYTTSALYYKFTVFRSVKCRLRVHCGTSTRLFKQYLGRFITFLDLDELFFIAKNYSFSLLLRILFEFKNDLYLFFYFRNWSGLQFAVQQGSGGPQSAAKEAWFITVAESWFYENEDLLPCEVADFMEEILILEFDLRVCS